MKYSKFESRQNITHFFTDIRSLWPLLQSKQELFLGTYRHMGVNWVITRLGTAVSVSNRVEYFVADVGCWNLCEGARCRSCGLTLVYLWYLWYWWKGVVYTPARATNILTIRVEVCVAYVTCFPPLGRHGEREGQTARKGGVVEDAPLGEEEGAVWLKGRKLEML
jgi:hypothetical protein